VALTGGIATGKTYVREQFERLGVPTSDADTFARAVVAPGTDGLADVVRAFGRDVLTSEGALDRRKLAAIVFPNPERRKELEAIVHPAVRRATDAWYEHLEPAVAFAIADIPLLYETGRDGDFEKVIVTACDPGTQLARVMKRDHLGESEARLRIAAQLPIAEKSRRADYVIRTDGSFEETERQVREVFEALRSLAASG
jgi:dephospho-CoA kinase